MPKKTLSPIDRLIVPLDVSSESEALELIAALPSVGFWKVGLELFVSCGPKILGLLKKQQKKVFLDLKFHDIPNTVAGACRAAADYGVDLLTVHATAGRRALLAAQEAVLEGAMGQEMKPPQLIAITLLTSLNSRDLALDLKVPVELPEFALQMALLAKESGLAGVVCSPQEVKQIKQVCGEEFLVVCPGVRPVWAQTGDQQRAMTPKQAVQAGADFLVIGRPITGAAVPREALQRICDEIAEA